MWKKLSILQCYLRNFDFNCRIGCIDFFSEKLRYIRDIIEYFIYTKSS